MNSKKVIIKLGLFNVQNKKYALLRSCKLVIILILTNFFTGCELLEDCSGLTQFSGQVRDSYTGELLDSVYVTFVSGMSGDRWGDSLMYQEDSIRYSFIMPENNGFCELGGLAINAPGYEKDDIGYTIGFKFGEHVIKNIELNPLCYVKARVKIDSQDFKNYTIEFLLKDGSPYPRDRIYLDSNDFLTEKYRAWIGYREVLDSTLFESIRFWEGVDTLYCDTLNRLDTGLQFVSFLYRNCYEDIDSSYVERTSIVYDDTIKCRRTIHNLVNGDSTIEDLEFYVNRFDTIQLDLDLRRGTVD